MRVCVSLFTAPVLRVNFEQLRDCWKLQKKHTSIPGMPLCFLEEKGDGKRAPSTWGLETCTAAQQVYSRSGRYRYTDTDPAFTEGTCQGQGANKRMWFKDKPNPHYCEMEDSNSTLRLLSMVSCFSLGPTQRAAPEREIAVQAWILHNRRKIKANFNER